MDFKHLPPSMVNDIPEFPDNYNLNYKDYAIMGGYGYNYVMPHNWLYNVTILPSIGYKKTIMTNTDTGHNSDANSNISLNYSGKMSLTYNHRSLFVSALVNFEGGFYFDDNYMFFNNKGSASAIVGVRF